MKSESPAKPRRAWWRFFVQFSLRSLLIVTTLAAVGCWWFLQPQVRDEEVAGKHLKLRRQVRVKKLPEQVNVSAAGGTGPAEAESHVLYNSGRWLLRDERNDLLVAGRYDNDQAHGKWIIYHTNGRKAVEGEAFRGAKQGLWRVWDEEGRLVSEVTYLAVKDESPVAHPLPRGKGMQGGGGMFGQVGPVAQGVGGLGGARLPTPPRPPPPPRYLSQRHGPARVWHASGKLKLEGVYQNDKREGPWTWYDDLGRVTAQGEYRADVRVRDSGGKETTNQTNQTNQAEK